MEHTPYPESGADGRRLGEALMREETDSEDSDDDFFLDPIKYGLSVWLAKLDYATDDVAEIPPSFIVHYRDLLAKGWGWQRLVPYSHGIDWTIFKGYLEEYYIQNAGEVAALSANEKPEKDKDYFCYITTKDATIKDKGIYTRKVSGFILGVVAEMCIETENNFRLIYRHRLTAEDITLSHQIEERANYVIQSAGVCCNAAAALVCIVKETVLLSELLDCRSYTTEYVKLCKKIRQSAFNLMLYEGPESAAAAGALVGLAKETKFLCYVLSREDSFVEPDYCCCHTIRRKTATALDVLLQECSSETSSGGHVSCALAVVKSEKPQGTVGYLNYGDVNATSAGAKSLKSQGTFGDLNYASDNCDVAGASAGAKSEKTQGTVVDLNCDVLSSMEQYKVDLSDCCEIDRNAKFGLTINKDDELEGEHLDASDLWKYSVLASGGHDGFILFWYLQLHPSGIVLEPKERNIHVENMYYTNKPHPCGAAETALAEYKKTRASMCKLLENVIEESQLKDNQLDKIAVFANSALSRINEGDTSVDELAEYFKEIVRLSTKVVKLDTGPGLTL